VKKSSTAMGSEIERIIVDECLGQASPVLDELRQRLDGQPVVCVFLSVRHPGIPDIEILDKLMDARSALLTQDRVLHNRALDRGFRSFVHTPETGLTDRRLAHVAVPDRRHAAAKGELRDQYTPRRDAAAQAVVDSLCTSLSERDLKRYGAKRRRIRAYFGSVDNIRAVDLTLSQRKTSRGVVGGYSLKVDSRGEMKALSPASEGYFLDEAGGDEPLASACWALLDLFMLQLQDYPATLYLLASGAHERCAALIADPNSASVPVEELTARLLASVEHLKAAPCVKGRFFDKAMAKLDQLATSKSNELAYVDMRSFAASLLAKMGADPAPSSTPPAPEEDQPCL
jgi:hypothetical protein